MPWASAAEAAVNSIDQDLLPDDTVLVAKVELDGAVLFRISGVSALPARRKTWFVPAADAAGSSSDLLHSDARLVRVL